MTSIVVIEDEPDIRNLLALYIEKEGWRVHSYGDGESGLEAIRALQPDFVVLDIGLPGDLDGLDVCRQLRVTSDVPVLFLTARDDEVDRILGLELGADDYVTKPFSAREIVARIKAVLRRGAAQTATTKTLRHFQFGSISIDLDRREVNSDGETISLATQELTLLESLLENQGIVLSRDQILNAAWGQDWVGDPRTVDVHIRQLRKKLGSDLPLVTVRGFGYRLG